MSKILLMLVFALFTMVDVQSVQAESAAAPITPYVRSRVKGVLYKHRPSYKAYGGQGRVRAKKAGVFRRWALRRKARRHARLLAKRNEKQQIRRSQRSSRNSRTSAL
ncbi:hypothetical protein LJY25_04085 [Hymenobacter sp. BT175]|uniref:hypothetical protein n=1 Tax=Hymenobacter translucens TaxID=2886507 RepID=UPI001D0E16A8|nr:hypothetical protein [Hymenobacter translucens]MCC2545612.1 hypothetical protein [Hymenobacter translucens]